MENTPDTTLTEAAAALERLAVEAESLLGDMVAALEAWRGDGDRTADRIDVSRALCLAAGRALHAVTSATVLAAGAAEQTRLHRDDAERTTRVWLARHMGVSRREAAALCRGAVALERFAAVEAALVDGEIAPGHLDALSSIVPARMRGKELADAIELVSELMPILLETARSSTVDEFELFCNHVRARLDQDGAPDRSAEPSRVYLSRLFDGRWALSGDLSADDGAILSTILDDVMGRLRAAARNGADQLLSSEVDDAPDDTAPDDTAGDSGPRPGSEWKADALIRLLLDGAGATRPGGVGLFLHIDLADLYGEVPDTAHTEANLDITDETLWNLLVGADVTPMFNTDGMPLSYGRTRRLAPPMLRRALAHRDRRCRFGWCDVPANSNHGHHIEYWDDGGVTDAANTALSCSFHHHCIHDRGWRLRGSPPDVTITRPDGTPHVVDQHWRTPQHERRRSEKRLIVARLERERRRLGLVA